MCYFYLDLSPLHYRIHANRDSVRSNSILPTHSQRFIFLSVRCTIILYFLSLSFIYSIIKVCCLLFIVLNLLILSLLFLMMKAVNPKDTCNTVSTERTFKSSLLVNLLVCKFVSFYFCTT